MPTHINQSDVTGTINMASPEAVTDAICAILARRYPDFDEAALRQAFADIVAAFWGRYPRLLACDTPYHDLRHSLGTALLMARLVDGYEIAHAGGGLGSEEGSLAVLLALYHDIGFLRRDNEATINGACLIRDHEQRSVDFTREYLAHSRFARFAEQAQLIHATNFARPIAETLHGLPRELFVIGQMLGTADLVSQIAGRYYLERCRDFLYPEFVIAGADHSVNAAGETVVLYATAEDLLRKTPGFYQHLAKPRLDKDFEQVWRYVEPHFGGDNPYARAMQHNLDYLRQLIERDDFSGLRRKPQAMMPAAG